MKKHQKTGTNTSNRLFGTEESYGNMHRERKREQVGVSVLFSIFTLLCGFIFTRNSNFFPLLFCDVIFVYKKLI